MRKLTILVFIEFYKPSQRGGGPIRSIEGLVEGLPGDYNWYIVTRAHDLGESVIYPGIKVDEWNTVGSIRIFYASSIGCSFRSLRTIIRDLPHDIVYVNSFFSPRFSIIPVILSKLIGIRKNSIIIAPRGEFSVGAFALKQWKKRLWVILAKMIRLYDDCVWQASTELEARDIVRITNVSTNKICVARDIALNRSSVKKMIPKRNDLLKICFLSRICRIKNLQGAIEILSTVRSNIEFTIYGPIEDPLYWHDCQDAILRLPANIRANYGGVVASEKVVEELAAHDILLLPTYGENYGHVFVEAWSAGLMVVTSDQTPWRGLAAAGVGRDFALSERAAFSKALEAMSGWSADEWAVASQRAMAFAKSIHSDSTVLEANRAMFNKAASQI